MGFGPLYVREYSRGELELLWGLLRRVQNNQLLTRYQAILFSHIRKSAQEISRLLNVSEKSLRNGIHIFDEHRFGELSDD